MESLAINNCLIVTQNSYREVFRGNILVEGSEIRYVGKDKCAADVTMDGSKLLAVPGFIDTHAHVAMSHLKGMIDDLDLEAFLNKTYDFDSKRTEQGIYNSALLGIREMISSGITCFADLYYSEDIIARACKDSGIRANLAWNTLDMEYTTQNGDPVANAERFISEHRNERLITPAIGVQGIYVASDETIQRAFDISEKYGTVLHMHLSETRKEVYDFVKKTGKRPVEHLSEKNFLRPNMLAAHAVWVTMREVKMLSKGGVSISWNSVSNAKLASGGLPPVPEMMSNGVNVSLGTDSSASNNSLDIFQEMKFSAISMKNSRWDPKVISAQQILDMATVNGSRAIGDKSIGSLETGKKADIVFLDLSSPNMVPTMENNAVNNVVYSANPSCVRHVMIDGVFLKKDFSLINKIETDGMNFV